MEHRLDWVDYAKGIGIILVVYGHLLSSGYRANLEINEHFFHLSDSIVYSFHMPLFFFLIGLLVPPSFQRRGPRNFLIDKFTRFAYPYLVWSVIQTSIQILYGKSQRGYTIDNILSILYQPLDQFWFLYALMWMFVAYALFKQFGKFATAVMVLSACVLFLNPIQTEIAALKRFSTEFLFFVLGIIVRVHIPNLQKFFVPLWATALLFVALLGSGFYIFENLIPPTRLIRGEYPFYFLYLSSLGIPACIGLSQYCSTTKTFSFLKTLGTYSLQIYLIHMLAGVAARVVQLEFFQIQSAALAIGIGVLSGLIGPIIIYRVSIRYQFPYFFRWTREEI